MARYRVMEGQLADCVESMSNPKMRETLAKLLIQPRSKRKRIHLHQYAFQSLRVLIMACLDMCQVQGMFVGPTFFSASTSIFLPLPKSSICIYIFYFLFLGDYDHVKILIDAGGHFYTMREMRSPPRAMTTINEGSSAQLDYPPRAVTEDKTEVYLEYYIKSHTIFQVTVFTLLALLVVQL